jgi:hypothetical protein
MSSVCYQDPVQTVVPAVFPDYDATTSTLSWIITGKYTSLISSDYLSQVKMQWTTEDPVIQSYISTAAVGYDLKVPAKSLKSGSSYLLKLNVTNSARTFFDQ